MLSNDYNDYNCCANNNYVNNNYVNNHNCDTNNYNDCCTNPVLFMLVWQRGSRDWVTSFWLC